MDTARLPQEIGLVRSMEDTAPSASTSGGSAAAAGGNSGGAKPPAMSSDRRIGRPQKEQALNCPRCNSNNTKFCYYNNYSLTQPRYFCKTCRRYWTEGGSLRNVPVGGGSRKNKRSSSAAPSSSSTASAASLSSTRRLLTPPSMSISSSMQSPKFSEGQDLNLGFHHPGLQPELDGFSNMELLRGGIAGRAGLIGGGGGFAPMSMPMPAPQDVYPAGFGLQDFRGFQLDGISTAGGSGGGGVGEGHDGGEGRILFPSGDAEMGQNRGQGGDGQGFWNGMMGGGGSW